MNRRLLLVVATALALAALSGAPRLLHRAAPASAPVAAPARSAPVASSPGSSPAPTRPEIGFRSAERLAAHFRKHGREFGRVTMDEYLRLAQSLRDRPAGGDVLEVVRSDGVVTRFDRASGAFLALDPDGTIRTFFRPYDGERYFRRQLSRVREGP